MLPRFITSGSALALLLCTVAVDAARLSVCQGQFGPDRGPAYAFSLVREGLSLPEVDEARLRRVSRAIYDSWGDLLAATPPFAVDARVLLEGDHRDFEAMKQQLAPELPSVSGFYAGQSNLAVVFYDGSAPVEAHRTTVHEISHLITTAQIGATPPWLAEGLAEYHEMIRETDSGLQVAPNNRHFAYLASASLPPLESFFAMNPAQWRESHSKDYYAIAWSLVYFMMDSPQGRGVMGQVLQQSSTHSCQAYEPSAFLRRAWPGGMSNFEAAWRAWVARGEFSSHALGV